MRKIIILGIASLFLFTSFNSIINAGEENTSDKIVTTYSFESPVISKVNINNTIYDSITIEGAPSVGTPGEPLLPGKGSYILLPSNSKVSNIVVNPGEMICLGSGYLVEPAGESIPYYDINNASIPVPDEKIYGSNDMFPGKLYSEIDTYRCKGYNILVLILHPVQYIPASGELFYYPELTVSVETIEEDNDISGLFRGLEKDEQEIMAKVDNSGMVSNYNLNTPQQQTIPGQSSPIGYDLVIITSEELKEGYEQLALAHNATGIRTFIKTVEDITGDPDYWVTGKWGDANPDNPFVETPITTDLSRFNDTSAKIRNFIRDAYSTLWIDYVLLGADNDVIPAKFFNGCISREYESVPSDLYYTGLDETWNRPENPYPENKDISINDANVIGSGGGFFSGPVVNYTDYVVGDSSMQWACTNINNEYGFCNLTFNTPMDLSGNRWLNFYAKSVKAEGNSYYINRYKLNSSDGSEISFGGEYSIDSKWGNQHIYIPESNVFNWHSVDSVCFEIKIYGELKIGDSLLLDGIHFSDFVDEWWGEPGDDDLYAEVYIGRAGTDNITEVNNFVYKTLKYISTDPNDNYLKKILMAGEDRLGSGEAQWGGNWLNELIDGSSKYGYTTVGIPSSEYKIKKLYQGPPGGIINQWWFPDQIIWQINNNIHIINHAGHSSYNKNMKIYNSDVDNLTNDKYCFIYSQGCMAGGFDDPEGYDCIAEHFTVKTSHGAFAGIWNTREGIGYEEGTDGPSQRFHREFWDAIFGENITVISKANQDSKEDNIWRIDESDMRFICYGLTLFGDPTIDLINHPGNTKPNKPDTPIGPTNGEAGVEYEYTTCATDPDGHSVQYGWDWNDIYPIEWTDFYSSGTSVTVSHSWIISGSREIRVKARDIFGAESEWSDTLSVSLPVNQQNSQSQQSSQSGSTTPQSTTSSTATKQTITTN